MANDGDYSTIVANKEATGMTANSKPGSDKEVPLSSDQSDARDFLSFCKQCVQRAADGRKRYDYEWMVRDMFRRGYHFSRYDPSTQTVILASRQKAKIPINIVEAQFRSIRNQVTSFQPKWEVLPRWGTEESKTQARYAGVLLDYLYDLLKLKTKIKETVTQGLMFSVGGPWQIYYDEEKKEINIWLLDPFDFYIDPYAEDLEDSQYCIKAVRRPLREVVTNQEFEKDARMQISGGEARLAVSEYKQFMIQATRNIAQYQTDNNSTVILFEGYFKMRKDDGKVFIRKVVWTDQNIDPLLFEDLDEDTYDFVIYRADLNPKEIYGESWMKHVMPLNRVIDNLESSVFEYNHRVAKGRIVVDRDSGVRAMHNVHGEIIAKNKGAEVRALDMPPLPIAVQNQIERFGRYIEDIGQVHDASLGRVPTGVKTGIGIAELKQADSTGQQDLVDNLEDFLTEVAKKILKKIARYYDSYHVIRAIGHQGRDNKYFAAIGDKAGKKGNVSKDGKQVKVGPDWLDLAIIGDDNNIRVTIGSWLGYTKEMMEQKLMSFAQAGLIDQKTFLAHMEFSDIDDIIQQTRKEQLLKQRIQNPSQPGSNAGEQDQYGLALTENEMMLEGKPVKPEPQDDHGLHIAIHQEVLGQGADDLVGQHILLHQAYERQQYGLAQNMPGTSEGVNPIDNKNIQSAVSQAGQPQSQPGQPQPGQPSPQMPSPQMGPQQMQSQPQPGQPSAGIGAMNTTQMGG